jgi:cytochrome c-type biogenesis protein CcmH
MLWLLIGVMTALAAGAVIVPLLRARSAAPGRVAYDRAVYRDQLAELERDVERGVLTQEQAASARIEIERRLLATANAEDAAPAGGSVDPVTVVSLVAAVSAASVALYLGIGSPTVRDQPFAARSGGAGATQTASATGTSEQQSATDLAKSAETLAAKLKENPSDVDGWVLLARTQSELERWQDAAASYQKAMALSDNRPDAAAGYGEMLVLGADGVVTPAAREAFLLAVKGDPDEPAARYYLALADAQAGKLREAVGAWAKLVADSPADASYLGMVRERMAAVAQEAGIETPNPTPKPPAQPEAAAAEAPRGPSQADMEAAAKMSPEERQAMIRSMVEGLAARLEQNPNDPAGWQRLANAYRVLGETAKAAEAEARAKTAQAGAASPAPAPPSAAAAPRGPSQADMEAAAKMSPEDRQAMIRSMVEGLAARLEQNPNDPAGWQRLANAYRVLGETDKAADAEARAKTAQAGASSAPAASAPAQTQTAAATPPGPNASDMAAAAKMSATDRAAMIRSMVDGLAQKLEKNPDDAEGWLRLGHAYGVLGETKKGEDALAKAAALQPSNPEVVLEQARFVLETEGDPHNASAKLPDRFMTLIRKVADLQPQNPTALWYLGLDAAQQRDPAAAKGYWQKLLPLLPPGSDDWKTVRQSIDALGKGGG